jgi:hypothetical protein
LKYIALNEKIDLDNLIDMLKDKDANIRASAFSFIIENNIDLENILSKYMDNRYYYNPVVVIDSMLYAPKRIKDKVIKDIVELKDIT